MPRHAGQAAASSHVARRPLGARLTWHDEDGVAGIAARRLLLRLGSHMVMMGPANGCLLRRALVMMAGGANSCLAVMRGLDSPASTHYNYHIQCYCLSPSAVAAQHRYILQTVLTRFLCCHEQLLGSTGVTPLYSCLSGTEHWYRAVAAELAPEPRRAIQLNVATVEM
jgi:hypothetical protein